MTSNLTALARRARARAPRRARSTGVGGRRVAVYCSDEAHHSVIRGVETCGHRLGRGAAHRRSTSSGGCGPTSSPPRSTPTSPTASSRSRSSRPRGRRSPARSTRSARSPTCARARGVWLHVDGAYGLPAAATADAPRRCSRASTAPTRRRSTRTSGSASRSRAASCCCAGPARCEATFGHEERYMLHEGDVANPVDRTLEYSRPLNSLRLWMAFRVHGADQYRAWIERTLDHARELARLRPRARRVRAPARAAALDGLLPPRPAGPAGDDLDAHNAASPARCSATGGSSSRPRSSTAARACGVRS